MANMKATPTTVSLTAEDRKIIRLLQKELEPKHGKLTTSGVFRVLLRRA
jgi:hypothetical protein